MRILFCAVWWLAAFAPAWAGAKPPSVSLRICLETEGAGSSNQSVPVQLQNPDQTVYVNPAPEASERDLVGAEAYSGPGGEQGALLHFNRHAAIALSSATMQHEGKILVVFLDGRIVYAPVIDAALSSGDFLIPRGVLPEEIALLQAQAKENLKRK
ncbi:MAG: hypothetical protein PW734_00340 [Verrucomicrobium sp.]|nr:hypothetical protein [Verrucomicrobium sp.]